MNSHLPLTIRPANINDFKVLADIWFEASVKAHHFIDENYWEQNKVKMQEVYLPMSEVYLIEDQENIHGFIALIENNIAAIFVSPTQQARGIGKALINHAKNIRIQLELNVYQENENSVRFYQSNDFKIIKETIDTNTNAKEFVMLWEK